MVRERWSLPGLCHSGLASLGAYPLLAEGKPLGRGGATGSGFNLQNKDPPPQGNFTIGSKQFQLKAQFDSKNTNLLIVFDSLDTVLHSFLQLVI